MFKNNHTSRIRLATCALTFLVLFSAPFFPALAAQEDASAQPVSSETSAAGASAIDALKAKAEQGNHRAQNALGEAYYYGRGVPVDKVEAVKWFRKAAEQGGSKAQFNLGRAYANGEGGLPKDPAEAAKWYGKSTWGPAKKALAKLTDPDFNAPDTPPPPEQWQHLKSEHCSMFTCGSVERAKADLIHLEQFYAAFCAILRLPPERLLTKEVTIIRFANKAQYDHYGKGSGGMFIPRGSENFIKFPGGDYGSRVLFHEYTHNIVNNLFGNKVTAFINEGLAVFFEVTKIEGDTVCVGDVRSMLRFDLVPMDTLVDITEGEALTPEGAIVYPQGWLLMHYLLIGRHGGLKLGEIGKIRQYVIVRSENFSKAMAFKDAFGVSLSEMDKILPRYRDELTSNSDAPQNTRTLTIPAAPIAAKITIEPVDNRTLKNALKSALEEIRTRDGQLE